MKTTEEIKNIWKKSLIEVTNEVFDEVMKTAAEETAKAEYNTNNIIACMSMVRDRMETTLHNNGLTDEDVKVVIENQSEWTKENMHWINELITDRLNLKEKLIKGGN